MNRIFHILIITLVGGFYAGLATAQMPDVAFAKDGPKVGDMVPDLVVVDDKGNPASLRKITEGHYSVFTLGCLT